MSNTNSSVNASIETVRVLEGGVLEGSGHKMGRNLEKRHHFLQMCLLMLMTLTLLGGPKEMSKQDESHGGKIPKLQDDIILTTLGVCLYWYSH